MIDKGKRRSALVLFLISSMDEGSERLAWRNRRRVARSCRRHQCRWNFIPPYACSAREGYTVVFIERRKRWNYRRDIKVGLGRIPK